MTAIGDTHRDVRLVRGPVRVVAVDPFPPGAGAECLFLGRTRAEAHPEHGALHRLDYHAYEEMALQRLEACADAAVDRFECRFVRLHHALGAVPVGDASVLVQTVSGHRDAAFLACRWLIDTLKEQVPIWKREVWADGVSWSEGQTPPEAGTLRDP